ncbi:MAG TPA: hypothetical protein VGP41_11190 [Candidatus Lustribacter sp.]|jgi:hypothetical protein|nr:hypothetical protein [Candidatus Lustribacter sp.]
MDETYICPDCMREHAEPQEAVLGHFARCQTCLLIFEAKPLRLVVVDRRHRVEHRVVTRHHARRVA